MRYRPRPAGIAFATPLLLVPSLINRHYVLDLMPGMGGLAKEAQSAVDRGELKRTEAIIRSMTPRERRDPSILNASRRRRIASAS